MRRMVLRATSSKLTRAPVVISPARTTRLSLTSVSAATLERLSWAKMASRIASEIWSATLSGWPSETDSEVKRKLLIFGAVPGRQKRAQRITHVVEPATHSMPILLRVLAAFPLSVLHAVGTVVGWLIYLGSRRCRNYLRENLEAAGYNDPAIRRAPGSAGSGGRTSGEGRGRTAGHRAAEPPGGARARGAIRGLADRRIGAHARQ